MNVPYEFDEARRAIQAFQGAAEFEEAAEYENFVKSVTQTAAIDIEGGQSPDALHTDAIRMGWYMRYGQVMADMMDKIALKCAAESTMSTLEAMQQIDKEVEAIYQEQQQRIVELAGQMLRECAAAISEIWQRVKMEIEKAWPVAIAAWEEIQKLIEEYENADEPEEEDRHDGAVEVLVTWLLPVPSLYELYGQGVDHGGPGLSRLTLTRVTDDGLRRAETGTKQERRQHNATEGGLQTGRSVRPGRRDRLGKGYET